MWRKQVITAVLVCIIGGAIANADLILTVNGLNLINSPLMIEGLGPILVAVAGNTPLEANDVSVTATGGRLTPLSDVNHRYNFEFNDNDESTFGNAFLIANNDISIEGKTVPAGTTICQLYFFCDREANIISVLYAGLADLISPEEEESE